MKIRGTWLALAAIAAMLAMPAARAAEGGATLARDVSVALYGLAGEVSMAMYDDTNPAFAKQARVRLEQMKPQVEAALQELAKIDAAAGTAGQESWQRLHDALVGGGDFGEGLLATGYDAKVHGDFDEGVQQINAALGKAWKQDEGSGSVEGRAYVLSAKTVAAYIKASASPFGSYTNSFNDDTDPVKLVARLDTAIAELSGKYKGNKENGPKVARVAAKWQFIRTTILKVGKQSTPLIVYKHGGDIVRDLKSLNP